MTSTMPPAEKATIARIGLVGQACAHVAPLAKARPRTDSNMKQIRVMPFSLVSRTATSDTIAGMRKVDVLDLLPHVVKHHAAFECDGVQMRHQQRKIVRRQARQESVGSSVLGLPGKRGRAIWHRGRS